MDLERLKASIDLLALVSQHTSLRKVAGSGGGEWAGACPFCGGRDRFRVQPHAPGGGRWLCRGCTQGKWQDGIEFGRRLWPGQSFQEVYQRLGGDTAYSRTNFQATPAHIAGAAAYAAPGEAWQAAARRALETAERLLWGREGRDALAYLRSRGLKDETIRYWRLGWSPGMKIPFALPSLKEGRAGDEGETVPHPNPPPEGRGATRDEGVVNPHTDISPVTGEERPSPIGGRAGEEGEASPHPNPSPEGRGASASLLRRTSETEEARIEIKTYPRLPPRVLARCRELRKNATKPEALLWQLLRNRQINGAKFRRQHPLMGYVLDFYCVEARLAIELDGSGHLEDEQARHDAERTRVLEAEGLRILRFWNSQVLRETEAVLEEILYALTAAPLPSSFGGRAGDEGETVPHPNPSPEGRGATRDEGVVNPHTDISPVTGEELPSPIGGRAGDEGETVPHPRPLSPRQTGEAPSDKAPPSGGEGSLWIPRGILIPCIALEQVWYLKVSLLPGQRVRCQGCGEPARARQPCPHCGGVNKYRGVKGNRSAAIFGAGELRGASLALFVEGEFDAMIAWQELSDVTAVCTLGSAANLPDLATWGALLAPVETLLAAYDADAAGRKGLAALQSLSERAVPCPLPAGAKDVNDFYLKGGNLWEWIKEVVEALGLGGDYNLPGASGGNLSLPAS